MHQVTDDPTFKLSRAGEHVLVDKTTRRRFPLASSDSLLLTRLRPPPSRIQRSSGASTTTFV